jgi:cytochrome c biogenesis protein CcmG/thiol:disulfide interchange protein DsbE
VFRRSNALKTFLVLTFLLAMSYALDPDYASSTPNADVSKAEEAKPVQRSDSPEDMQKLLAETAETYREAKSFRIEREMVDATESELMTLSNRSLSSNIVAPENRYQTVYKDARTWEIHQSDGKTEWIWYPWRKQYVERPVERSSDPERLTPAENGYVAWLKQIDKKLASGRVQLPQTIDIGHGRVNCMVIMGPPSPRQHDPTMQQQTTYWIDRDRKILVKEQFVMRSTVPEHKFDSEGTTTYTTTEFNTSFPDSLFNFVPPMGAKRVEKFEFGPVELVGKTAPPLRLNTLDGKEFDLGSLRGKPVLVDFWATWCMPCRESMPHLAKLYDEFKGKGLALVSVSKDDDPADAARFVAKYKYSWLNVADPKWESDGDWGESGIPRLVLIGKDGKVLFESEGFDEAQEAKIRATLHHMDPTFPAVDGSRE